MYLFKKLFEILHNYALGVVGIDVAGDEGHLEEGMDALFDQVDFLISNDLKLIGILKVSIIFWNILSVRQYSLIFYINKIKMFRLW